MSTTIRDMFEGLARATSSDTVMFSHQFKDLVEVNGLEELMRSTGVGRVGSVDIHARNLLLLSGIRYLHLANVCSRSNSHSICRNIVPVSDFLIPQSPKTRESARVLIDLLCWRLQHFPESGISFMFQRIFW